MKTSKLQHPRPALKFSHPEPSEGSVSPTAPEAPSYLNPIFNLSRKYRNHKRFVHPDLL
jgi:hypothetical protein